MECLCTSDRVQTQFWLLWQWVYTQQGHWIADLERLISFQVKDGVVSSHQRMLLSLTNALFWNISTSYSRLSWEKCGERKQAGWSNKSPPICGATGLGGSLITKASASMSSWPLTTTAQAWTFIITIGYLIPTYALCKWLRNTLRFGRGLR